MEDSAYPLSQHMMVPFRDNGHLNNQQTRFNMSLSCTRVCIEQAFGILKQRFRILKFLEIYKLKNAKHYVLSCVALHNHITQCQGLTEDYDEILENDSNRVIQEVPQREENLSRNNREAQDKRNAIMTLISA